jgi:hypothetical protein
MATVRLYREGEDKITGLPCVCMRCGAPATRTGSLPYVKRVAVPLCEKHWYYPRLARALQFAVASMCLLFAAYQFWKMALQPLDTSKFVGYLAIGFFLFVLVVHLVSWLVLESGIRSKTITNTCVELTGVAPRFVVAVVQEWEVIGEHFDASARGDERVIPSVNDIYRVKQ